MTPDAGQAIGLELERDRRAVRTRGRAPSGAGVDAEQVLRAAAAIGDDRLQKMTTGHVMPDRFTHGTSAQRVDSFKRGMDSGDLRACGAAARGTQ